MGNVEIGERKWRQRKTYSSERLWFCARAQGAVLYGRLSVSFVSFKLSFLNRLIE